MARHWMPAALAPIPGLALVAVLSACGEDAAADAAPVTVRFEATVNGAPFACGATYPAFGPFSGPVQAGDLRLYVHDLEMLSATGAATPIALSADGAWQSDRLAYLDFEDGTGGCLNGTTATRAVVEGAAPAGDYVGLRFTVGVPFDLNHGDPVRATAPLGRTAMHWGWQGGHKFLRLSLTDGDTDSLIHLGSTGCQGTVAHVTGCDRPNRAVVTVTGFDPTTTPVRLDVAALLDALRPGEDAACMGDAATYACAGVFQALGLDLQTGAPTAPAGAFSAGG